LIADLCFCSVTFIDLDITIFKFNICIFNIYDHIIFNVYDHIIFNVYDLIIFNIYVLIILNIYDHNIFTVYVSNVSVIPIVLALGSIMFTNSSKSIRPFLFVSASANIVENSSSVHR